MKMSTDIIKKESLAEICGHRDRALMELKRCADAFIEANAAIQRVLRDKHPHNCISRNELLELCYSDNGKSFMEAAIKQMDRSIWRKLLSVTGLGSLMDREAKQEFEKSIENNPPPADFDTIAATFMSKTTEAPKIFERGIVNAFMRLDKEYHTNSAFRICKKAKFKGAFTSGAYSSWNHYVRADDEINDIERIFMIMDGKTPKEGRCSEIIELINTARGGKKNICDNEYFSCRWFVNGNLDVEFKRPDLVERCNHIIAKHYSSAIGDDRPKRR